MSYSKTAIVIAPLFWPQLPPLSLITLGSFLINKGEDVSLVDLNNHFFNLSGEREKKSWSISCNRALEQDMTNMLKNQFKDELESMIEKLEKFEETEKAWLNPDELGNQF